MNKENIFPLAIGTYGLGASRSESWEDNNKELVNISDNYSWIYVYEGKLPF